MSNPAIQSNEVSAGEADQRLSALWRAIAAAAVILLLATGSNAWIYLHGVHRVRSKLAVTATNPPIDSMQASRLALSQWSESLSDKWVLALTSLAAIGGTGFLVIVVARFTRRQRVWAKRLAVSAEEGQRTAVTLREQLAQSRLAHDNLARLQSESEERTRDLENANAVLKEELARHKRTERTLDRERQHLVRSKDVLELHVQARTQALQQLQHRYELILNSAGEGICGLDMEGRATFVNPAAAKITGWRVEELVGKSEKDIFDRNGADEMAANGNGDAKDHLFRRKDGTRFPAEIVKTQIQENGREMGAVVIFKDITERKRAEEALGQKATELARSNAELEQFAFVASHDLQEPLRKIQAFGDRLKTRCDAAQLGEARDFLERMQNAAARMQTLINDLLTFSRVIRSSQPFVPVDLGAVTREVLGDLEVRIEKTGARVETGELPTIDADPMQMRQLMQNLISNALKFQPPNAKPVVKIRARCFERPYSPWNGGSSQNPSANGSAAAATDELCEISVEDNGIGFDEKYMDKIFAVFQRLHGRTEYEGTGVGLAVCRRIVDRHGGSITARSQPGPGATFVVTLPVHQSAASTKS